jgi:hypothetical protein
MTDAPELRQNDREVVLRVFTRELPHTARLLNAPVVTEEIVFGHGYTAPDEDELPPQEWYDRHQTVLDELVGDGILQTGEALGMTIYGLTVAYQRKYEEGTVDFLMQKARQLRNRAEEKGGPGADELMRRAAIMDSAIGALKTTEEVKPV